MNYIDVLLVLLISLSVVAATHRSYDVPSPSQLRLLEELEMELDMEDLDRPVSRARRVPQKQIFCGRRLVKYVLGICGGACTASTGIDIATTCCSSQCGESYIRKACCP